MGKKYFLRINPFELMLNCMVSMATHNALLQTGYVLTKILQISPAATYPKYLTWYQLNVKTKDFHSVFRYSNFIICIFMNKNENIKN